MRSGIQAGAKNFVMIVFFKDKESLESLQRGEMQFAGQAGVDVVTYGAAGTPTYNEGVALCIEAKDTGSRDLMERMVVESEESIDWAESQFDLIRMIGIEKYLAQQMGESAE